ncbi:geraniol 8-hydroxylase-like [Punica granatum]|uniref:Uncharacterized protein n=2 Tax=Punica granatum TaxID=22663 RepID=A0A218WLS3_PUNGR|nr:geraniol 8-hydroxylase-like [Punica granatum]OWM73533.1 hypothetical protein CDL15_Pgr026632 [Punica granatum]PKI77190.1 hypothetical protein CRG98_002400 [Punica granatum]
MDFLLLILGLCLSWGLLQALVYIANRGKSNKVGKLPPGPRPLPVIGNLLELGSLPHRSLAKLASAHGPIMSLKLGRITTVVISSSSMAREILQTHDVTFCNRMSPDSVTAVRHDELGLPWIPVAPLWRNLRRICNVHLFALKTIDSSQHLRHRKIQELLAYIGKCSETRSSVGIGEAGFSTTLNLLGNTTLSMDLADPTSESAKEFKELVWQIMAEVGKPNLADYFPVLRRMDPQGVRRRTTGYNWRMFDVFDRIINDRLQVREVPGSVRKYDMLDTLLDLVEDKKEGMDLFLMKHLFLDLFSAGTDTTSSTLEWAMAELLRNPEKLSKAQAELEQVMGRGNPIEESDIDRLPYLQATVKETFRMHPAAPLLLPRRAGATVQVGGYTIPEGAQVLVNVWAIGRNLASWKNPDEFIPERFLGLDVDVKGQNFELLPFGGGRRICPGLQLAMRMLHLMLGSLLNSFDWKLEDGVTPETMEMGDKFGITLQKAQPLRAVPLPIKK